MGLIRKKFVYVLTLSSSIILSGCSHNSSPFLATPGTGKAFASSGQSNVPPLNANPEWPALQIIMNTCEHDNINDCKTKCNQGNAVSCSYAAHIYKMGWFAPQDEEKSNQYYEKYKTIFENDCKNGTDMKAALSCYFIGKDYTEGAIPGIPQDAAIAARYIKRSCDLGSETGCESSKISSEPEPARIITVHPTDTTKVPLSIWKNDPDLPAPE